VPGGGFGGGGFGGGGFGGGTAQIPTGPIEDLAPYKDRVTQEDMLDDSVFTILVAVSLDPPAYAPPAPAGGGTAAEGQQP
jgi:hypothetical protein